MSFQVTTHFVNQYKANVALLIQHKGSKLGDTVSSGQYFGEGARVVEQIGITFASRNLPRHADTPVANTPSAARWVYPNDYDWGDLIDKADRLRMITDIRDGYAKAAAVAIGREKDQDILLAAASAARTGQNGATSTTLPGGQTVGVNVGGTGSNLNVAKVRAARRLLMAQGVDVENETLTFVVTASDHDALLNDLLAYDGDTVGKPLIVDGRIISALGFQFKHVEFNLAAQYARSSVDGAGLISGSNRLLPVYAKSAVHWGMWNEFSTRIDELPSKRYSWQLYCNMIGGATRLDEAGVVLVTTTG